MRTHYAHNIHIRVLFWLYQRTGDPFFLEYAFKWQNYKQPALPAKLYRNNLNTEDGSIDLPDSHRENTFPNDTTAVIIDVFQVMPLRSFAFNAVEPYPADYTLSVSADGSTWQQIAAVKDSTMHHASIDLKDVSARYVRMTFDRMVKDNPFYDQLYNGAYSKLFLFGPFRVDGDSYWDDPIFLIDEPYGPLDSGQLLRDDNPDTSVPFDPGTTLYVDLRAAKNVHELDIRAANQEGERQAWLETSNDLKTWTPLIPQAQPQNVKLPGIVTVPAADAPYRYVRLHLDGGATMNIDSVSVR
jgi:hypothetical protein